MAVSWGAWEGSNLRMRVGLEVNVPGNVGHGANSVTINVEYWTENEFGWDDDQSLNLGGAIGGSIGYHNGQGGTPVKRGERNYTYNYGANEYKTNAQRSFSATVNGAFNGITPSKSVTINIPDRDYGSPARPTGAAVSRISDESNKVTWNNQATAGAPYDGVKVGRLTYGHGDWVRVANLGGGAESYSDAGAIPNRKYQYRVFATNNVGSSTEDETGIIWTSPATPTGCTRTPGTGTNQVISWTNNTDYSEYQTQVWRAVNGVWESSPVGTSSSATYTDTTTTDTSKRYKYRVRARTTSGQALYSSYSGETSETSGSTTPPNAPDELAPDGSITLDPTGQIWLSWTHRGTTAMTKYEIQHREAGGSWETTGEQPATMSSHSLPANEYGYDKTIEWQVRTWGADPAPSPWSASAIFKTRTAVAVKYPLLLDVTSGRVEADSTGTHGGGGPGTAIPAHAHAGKAAGSHTFDDATFEGLSFDTLVSQTGSVTVNTQSAVSTTSTFTIVETGVYDCSAGVAFAMNPAGRRVMRLIVNGVTTVQQESAPFTGSTGSGQAGPQIATTLQLNAGDALYFDAYQNSGGNLAAIVRGDLYWGRVTKVDAGIGPQGPPGPEGGLTGVAGGDLSGSYPNPQLAPGVVTSTEIGFDAVLNDHIADNAVATAQLANGAVTSAKIADGTIATADLSSAVTTAIADAAVNVLEEGIPLVTNARQINFKGAGVVASAVAPDVDVTVDGVPQGNAGGSLAGTYPNPTLAANSVGVSQITDGSITDVEVAAANKDGVAGTPSLRTLGTGAQQASAGNHSHAGLAPALPIKDEGSTLTGTPSELNFVGAGVAATGGPAVTVTIPGVPIGSIVMWYAATFPNDWLLCNGQVVPAQYTELIALIGTTTPNLVARFPLGVGATQPSNTTRALASTGGADQTTLTTTQMPTHNHLMTHGHDLQVRTSSTMGANPDRVVAAGGATGQAISTAIQNFAGTTGDRGSGSPWENIPPYLALHFIIKAA